MEGITSPPVTHLRHCPLPPGQPVTGSLWVPQSAAGPPLGGGAVADMKEGKAAMDWQTAWTVRFLGLGLTRGVGPRPALPVPLPTMATAAPPPQLPLPLLRQWLRVAHCLEELTNLSHYSRDTDQTPPWQTKKNAHHHPGPTQTPWKACS